MNQRSLPLPVPAAPTPPRAAPHNLEAEQGLLGAILFDNETYNRITPNLQERHFYDPVHGRIFAACAQLISAGELADGVTLGPEITSISLKNGEGAILVKVA